VSKFPGFVEINARATATQAVQAMVLVMLISLLKKMIPPWGMSKESIVGKLGADDVGDWIGYSKETCMTMFSLAESVYDLGKTLEGAVKEIDAQAFENNAKLMTEQLQLADVYKQVYGDGSVEDADASDTFEESKVLEESHKLILDSSKKPGEMFTLNDLPVLAGLYYELLWTKGDPTLTLAEQLLVYLHQKSLYHF